MDMEQYVGDLDRFIKDRMTIFLSEYYLRDPEHVPGYALKEFIEQELEKVTFSVESAYIMQEPDRSGTQFRVNLKMGNDVYSTCLRISPEVLNHKK